MKSNWKIWNWKISLAPVCSQRLKFNRIRAIGNPVSFLLFGELQLLFPPKSRLQGMEYACFLRFRVPLEPTFAAYTCVFRGQKCRFCMVTVRQKWLSVARQLVLWGGKCPFLQQICPNESLYESLWAVCRRPLCCLRGPLVREARPEA